MGGGGCIVVVELSHFLQRYQARGGGVLAVFTLPCFERVTLCKSRVSDLIVVEVARFQQGRLQRVPAPALRETRLKKSSTPRLHFDTFVGHKSEHIAQVATINLSALLLKALALLETLKALAYAAKDLKALVLSSKKLDALVQNCLLGNQYAGQVWLTLAGYELPSTQR